MVSAAARSTTAATLVFIASVLLIAPDAPLWCVAIALGAAAWRILVGQWDTWMAQSQSASPVMQIKINALITGGLLAAMMVCTLLVIGSSALRILQSSNADAREISMEPSMR